MASSIKDGSISSKHVTLLLTIVLLLSIRAISFCLGHGHGGGHKDHIKAAGRISCIESERRALLAIKSDMYDPGERFSSWIGKLDCCQWGGVACDNATGHVTKLDLHYPYTYDVEFEIPETMGASKVNPSLLDLKHLKYLDLSMNNFSGAHIPEMMASLVHLEYLNLSNAMFSGIIPPQLGNLSSLRYLDLKELDLFGCPPDQLRSDDLDWLSRIPSLKHLDMSCVNLSKATNWLHQINSIPTLEVLHLSSTNLAVVASPLPPFNLTSITALDLSAYQNFTITVLRWLSNAGSIQYLDLFHCRGLDVEPLQVAVEILGNLTSLRHLSLGGNQIAGEIPETLLGNLVHLEFLDLSSNNITGDIPLSMGNLTKLVHLDLSMNNIAGWIPNALGDLVNLEELDLSVNNISGQVPEIIGNLQNLQFLYLHFNSITGQIPETIGILHNLQDLVISYNELTGKIPRALSGLCNLNRLDLSYNDIGGEITNLIDGLSNCTRGTRLSSLQIGGNNLSGIVPSSLGQLSELYQLYISSNSLEGNISEAHFSKLTDIEILDISHNSLNVILPNDWLPPFNAYIIDMSFCNLGTKFPVWIQTQTNLDSLYLSSVGLSGNVLAWFWDPNNSFLGSISLGLSILSLSHNHINGSIPSLFCNMTYLEALDLSNNNLSGKVPNCRSSFPSSLQSLHLNNNNLSGRLPSFLRYCKQLVTLDLGDNRLFGEIPTWIGKSLSMLKDLHLRSNLLHGFIPESLGDLTSLQVLDLSSNNLFGSIPSSVGNFSAMFMLQNGTSWGVRVDSYYYDEEILISAKGSTNEYTSIISLVTSIDLSNNNLSGEIPEELTHLLGLRFLNLSNNQLSGTIPEKIGALGQLESLDLSMNNLIGEIPSSLSDLNFSSHLNISYNNLSGRIPTGSQLSTFSDDPSVYIGNEDLCGMPLPKCPGDDAFQSPPHAGDEQEENSDKLETMLEVVSIVMGFIVGFWGCIGIMIMKQAIRVALFQFTDKTCDWIYVQLAIKLAKLKPKWQTTV